MVGTTGLASDDKHLAAIEPATFPRRWRARDALIPPNSRDVKAGKGVGDDSTNAGSALLRFDFALASEGIRARRVDFVARHPPRAAVSGCKIDAALVFVKSLDEVIALASVEAAGAGTLQDVDEVHT